MIRIILALLAALFAVQAKAALLPYLLVLQVGGVTLSPECPITHPFEHHFPCDLAAGDVFAGTFKIDSSLLSMEGDNLMGEIFDFRLRVGSVLFDQNFPTDHPTNPSDFEGFRGPTPDNPDGASVAAPAPGFDVHNGVLTDLTGGFYGAGDAIFFDFFPGSPPNSVVSRDGFETSFAATMLLFQLPEPPTVALLFVLMLWLGVFSGRPRRLDRHALAPELGGSGASGRWSTAAPSPWRAPIALASTIYGFRPPPFRSPTSR